MRGLTIVLSEAAPARVRTALTMALAQVAIGGRARLFLDGLAVAVLRAPITAPDDALHVGAGQPSLSALADEALAAGVRILLCQTGLDLAQIEAGGFDGRSEFGGIVGLLATLEDDRLVAL